MDKILEQVAPRTPAMSEEDALFAEMEAAGVDLKGAQSELKAEADNALKEQHAALNENFDRLELKRRSAEQQSVALDTAVGIGVGVRKVAQNTYNGLVDLADMVENYAATKGIGTGDLINASNAKVDLVQGLDKDMDGAGKVADAVTQFVTPLVATMGAGGSFKLGVGVNALYNFLAIDPKAQRLSDHLKDTAFAEMPVAADVINALATKPEDSELDARMKNMIEGLGLDLTLGGIAWGASRAYSGIKTLRNPKLLREAEKAITNADIAPKVQVLDDAARAAQAKNLPDSSQIPTINEPAKLANPDVPKTPVVGTPEDAAQLDLFEKEWAKMEYDSPRVTVADDGQVRMKLSDDQLVNRFLTVAQENEGQILRTPISDAETIEAAELLRKDPAVVDRLAAWKQGDPVITDQETLVMKYIFQQADASMMDNIGKMAANINDDVSLIRFSREFENYMKILTVKIGMGSAKGATLRAEQIVANLAASGDKEAIKQVGAQGRAQMVNDLIDLYGGRENIKGMVKDLDFIKDMSKIAAKPDADFAVRMGEVVQLSTWNKINQAITKVAINGMLSSPMTPFKAAITNAATTAKTAIDNYVAVGIGAIRGNQSRQTIAEANAHMSGMVEGLIDNIKPALKGDKVYRIDVAEGRKKILGYDDAMFNATGAWVKSGMALESAIEVPSKVLMSVDAYWHGVNVQGYIRGEAVRRAISQKLEGQSRTDFIEGFLKKPPRDVLYHADKVAGQNTMAKNLEGVAAAMDQVIERGGDYIPLARVVLPFFKTNANLIEYTIKNSPLAGISNEFRTALMRGGREADMAIAKATTGTVAIGLMTYLATNKLVVGNATDFKFDRALKDNKTIPQETSIKVGDKWVSIKGLEPLSTFVNVAALMAKASSHIDQDQYQEAAIAAGLAASDIFTPEQLMGSISSIMDVIKGKQTGMDFLAGIPSRLLPYGSALQDVRQTIDPRQRVVKAEDFYTSLKNSFKNKIPGMSKDLPSQRNIWGESLNIPDGIGPDAISPFATSDGTGIELKRVLEEMDDYYEQHKTTNFGLYKLDIAMPGNVIPNSLAPSVPYELTPKEKDAYILYAAGLDPATGKGLVSNGITLVPLKKVVESALKEFVDNKKQIADQDPENYAKAVAKIQGTITAYRNLANKKIMDYGLVGSKMGEAAQKFKTLELGGGNVGQ